MAVTAVGAAAALVLAAQGTWRQIQLSSVPTPPVLTGVARVGQLESTLDETGQLTPVETVTITLPSVGASANVVTKPSPEGSVPSGAAIAEIAGSPIIALVGAVPMYRTLAFGTVGSDVTQLQAALRALNLPVKDPNGHFGTSTAAAVWHLYTSDSYFPPDASGQPIQRLSGSRGISLSVGSIVYATTFPIRVSGPCGTLGATVASGQCSVSSETNNVISTVPVSDASRVKPGMQARLSLSDGTDKPAHVVSIAETPPASAPPPGGATTSGTGSASTMDILITPDDPLRSDQALSQVQIVLAVSKAASLVVPSTTIFGDKHPYVIQVVTLRPLVTKKIDLKVSLCDDTDCVVEGSRSLLGMKLKLNTAGLEGG